MKQFIVTWADDADSIDMDFMEEAIEQCYGDFHFEIVES